MKSNGILFILSTCHAQETSPLKHVLRSDIHGGYFEQAWNELVEEVSPLYDLNFKIKRYAISVECIDVLIMMNVFIDLQHLICRVSSRLRRGICSTCPTTTAVDGNLKMT